MYRGDEDKQAAAKRLNGSTRHFRRVLARLHDIAWIPGSLLLAFYIQYGGLSSIQFVGWERFALFALIAVACNGTVLWLRGCYRGLWRFASLPDLIRLVQAIVLGSLLAVGIGLLSGVLDRFPRSILLIYPLILLVGLGLGRIVYRSWKDRSFVLGLRQGKRAVVVGGGQAGALLIRDLASHGRYVPVAILDDDKSKIGREIHGVRVRGALRDLPQIARRYSADTVLFAMPSAAPSVLRMVMRDCNAMHLLCQTLPFSMAQTEGPIVAENLRPVIIEDLLGRDPIQLGNDRAAEFLRGRRVLVTGGGGSIGSELCRQIVQLDPARLIILDHSEYSLYQIAAELETAGADRVQACLGSVCDERILNKLFSEHSPEIVFHAAAYKHVPLVEENPLAGIRVNVFGTQCVAEASVRHGVKRFVQISTDKAVNPTNVMGATKRLAELYCRTAASKGGCQFVVTRFGNVLGSSGSVVPRFSEQIAAGGPVTVTHQDITRFFMTIPEAVNLILEAAASDIAGGVFVLDMGDPVRITDLAREMIRLSGLEAGVDIQIEYSGLRPGEKLYEELFYAAERPVGTGHPKLLLAESEASVSPDVLEAGLAELEAALSQTNRTAVLAILRQLVPEYCSSESGMEAGKSSHSSARVIDFRAKV